MNLTGNENHDITLSAAAAMTKRYRESVPPGSIISHCFGKQAIKAILDQPGCVGMRVYYGLNAENTKQLIVTGVAADGNDMYEGLLAERTFYCPPECAAANPLNE